MISPPKLLFYCSDQSVLNELVPLLMNRFENVVVATQLQQLREAIDPGPWMLLFYCRHLQGNAFLPFLKLKKRYPHNAVVAVVPRLSLDNMLPYLVHFDDFLGAPVRQDELAFRLLKACEKQARQLPHFRVAQSDIVSPSPKGGGDSMLETLRQWSQMRDNRPLLEAFLDVMGAKAHPVPLFYFQYLRQHHALRISHCRNFSSDRARGLGFRLHLQETPEHLQQPHKMLSLIDFLYEALGSKTFFATPLETYHGIEGIFVTLAENLPSEVIADFGKFKSFLQVGYERNLEMQRSHNDCQLDRETRLYNKKWFDQCLDAEMNRARRWKTSLSVMVVRLDSAKPELFIKKRHYEACLDALARLFVERGRKYDVAGRVDATTFVLLLPRTDYKQAICRANRMRRDWQRYVGSKTEPAFNIAQGIATYPTHVEDTLQLIQRAMDAADYAMTQEKDPIVVAGAEESQYEPLQEPPLA